MFLSKCKTFGSFIGRYNIIDITVYLQVENTMKTPRFKNNMNIYT